MKSVVKVPSSGNYLYGEVVHVTNRGLMIVRMSHRRQNVEITRKIKGKVVVVRTYLADWEEVKPERLVCAWQGKFSRVRKPKEANDGSID